MPSYNSGWKNFSRFIQILFKHHFPHLNLTFDEMFNNIINEMSSNVKQKLPFLAIFKKLINKKHFMNEKQEETLNSILKIIENPEKYQIFSSNKKIIKFRGENSENSFYQKCHKVFKNMNELMMKLKTQPHLQLKPQPKLSQLQLQPQPQSQLTVMDGNEEIEGFDYNYSKNNQILLNQSEERSTASRSSEEEEEEEKTQQTCNQVIGVKEIKNEDFFHLYKNDIMEDMNENLLVEEDEKDMQEAASFESVFDLNNMLF